MRRHRSSLPRGTNGQALSDQENAHMPDVDPLDLVATIREGLLVLGPDLTVRFANRSFCDTFRVAQENTIGRKLHELGDGQWDIPQLRTLLETIIPAHATIEAFEVDHVFPSIGRRVMLLNARTVYQPTNSGKQILLAIEDVTERVMLERERAAANERVATLLQECTATNKRIATLLQELAHRVKNNLQAITAMVRIEAGRQTSGAGKAALERVSDRIGAIGRLYAKLDKAETIERVDAATYLAEMCADLIASVQRAGKAISLKTEIATLSLSTRQAIPIGLVVNELVMNAVKYAFPGETSGTITVTLDRGPRELRLTVADRTAALLGFHNSILWPRRVPAAHVAERSGNSWPGFT
jgi:two-component sensor histidine kinase